MGFKRIWLYLSKIDLETERRPRVEEGKRRTLCARIFDAGSGRVSSELAVATGQLIRAGRGSR